MLPRCAPASRSAAAPPPRLVRARQRRRAFDLAVDPDGRACARHQIHRRRAASGGKTQKSIERLTWRGPRAAAAHRPSPDCASAAGRRQGATSGFGSAGSTMRPRRLAGRALRRRRQLVARRCRRRRGLGAAPDRMSRRGGFDASRRISSQRSSPPRAATTLKRSPGNRGFSGSSALRCADLVEHAPGLRQAAVRAMTSPIASAVSGVFARRHLAALGDDVRLVADVQHEGFPVHEDDAPAAATERESCVGEHTAPGAGTGGSSRIIGSSGCRH